jgi:hypothetical protein
MYACVFVAQQSWRTEVGPFGIGCRAGRQPVKDARAVRRWMQDVPASQEGFMIYEYFKSDLEKPLLS